MLESQQDFDVNFQSRQRAKKGFLKEPITNPKFVISQLDRCVNSALSMFSPLNTSTHQ